MLAVIEAKYLKDFKIRLTFNNGKSGEVDLQKIICNDRRFIFKPLKDKENFRKFTIKFNTIAWSDEVDLAPEFLYFQTFENDISLQKQFRKWGYI